MSYLYILVTGYRNYPSDEIVHFELDRVAHEAEGMPIFVITGGCETGADKAAIDWAKHWEHPYATFPAQWKLNGKGGGPIRNYNMVAWMNGTLRSGLYGGKDNNIVCLAFDSPRAKGTKNCIQVIEEFGFPLSVFDEKGTLIYARDRGERSAPGYQEFIRESLSGH